MKYIVQIMWFDLETNEPSWMHEESFNSRLEAIRYAREMQLEGRRARIVEDIKIQKGCEAL